MLCMVEHKAVEDSIGNILELCQLFFFSKEKLQSIGKSKLKTYTKNLLHFHFQYSEVLQLKTFFLEFQSKEQSCSENIT